MKMVVVRHPLKAIIYCTIKRACATTFALVVVGFSVAMPVVFTRGNEVVLHPDGTEEQINCGFVSDTAAYIETRVNSWIVTTAIIIPMTMTIILNCTIIVSMQKMKR